MSIRIGIVEIEDRLSSLVIDINGVKFRTPPIHFYTRQQREEVISKLIEEIDNQIKRGMVVENWVYIKKILMKL